LQGIFEKKLRQRSEEQNTRKVERLKRIWQEGPHDETAPCGPCSRNAPQALEAAHGKTMHCGLESGKFFDSFASRPVF
jgi:hypothetical protein